MSKRLHLTASERNIIEQGLNEGCTYREIAEQIGKHPSTIQREVQRYATYIYQDDAQDICLKQKQKLCNACKQRTKECGFIKREYNAYKAHLMYKNTLSNAHKGFRLSEEDCNKLNDVLYTRLKKGQSVFHICKSEDMPLDVSVSTVYRLINSGKIEARNIDLRYKTKMNHRRPKYLADSKIKKIKAGHLYNDYLSYRNQHQLDTVEVDCVKLGAGSRKVLLTLYFPNYHFQMAFLLASQSTDNVVETLDNIERKIGVQYFRKLFPILLVDNGREFLDIRKMERSINGIGKRTRVFFCDPLRADQKGACENNHKLIRYFNFRKMDVTKINQSDITMIMNHVNSLKRNSLNGQAPYDVASKNISQSFFDAFGYKRILDEDVTLNNILFDESD